MSYYWFNRQELLQKAKKKKKKYDNGGKENAAESYQANKHVIKKANSKYKNLTEEEKETGKSMDKIVIRK